MLLEIDETERCHFTEILIDKKLFLKNPFAELRCKDVQVNSIFAIKVPDYFTFFLQMYLNDFIKYYKSIS